MAFQQTLKWIQVTRALAILSTCISVIFFSFTANSRTQETHDLVKQLAATSAGIFGNPRSGFSSVALFGLAVSLVFNGLGLFDLCIKKHYRFERRTCMAFDMLAAVILIVTGFLNITYDAFLYFDFENGLDGQMAMEFTAVAFLGLTW